ncbi:histidine phosphatase family protein [Mariniblastus fucicola]|uniref:Alpha-ribazole phosphatase n=1 Tax=Mariniblastus fucicola TaxID=980251 RepID=A0A5B9PMV4_9BACT|nr:histidine phosphatase family protein [Mariniblastus fucicola]QEG23643.1 Alpha-ribazole phosphatase [Mariniblastus fucicola]
MIEHRHNRFFALRHGVSEANELGLIISDPKTGCSNYGLSSVGRAKLERCLEGYLEQIGPTCRIVSSDFLRTRHTAELLAERMVAEVEFSVRLRERYFGDFESTSNLNYQTVWQQDAADPEHSQWNVESVSSVADRVLAELQDLNESAKETTFVIVSHGDSLQILETALKQLPLSTHRERDPLQPGELRELSPN